MALGSCGLVGFPLQSMWAGNWRMASGCFFRPWTRELVKGLPVQFIQSTIVAAIMAICPGVSWEGFKFPCVEVLSNHEALKFQNVIQTSAVGRIPLDLCLPQPKFDMDWLWLRAPAAASGKAMLSLISFGLMPTFETSLRQLDFGLPFEQLPLPELEEPPSRRMAPGVGEAPNAS